MTFLRVIPGRGAEGAATEPPVWTAGWSNQDLAEFWRCTRLLGQAGLRVSFDHGVSDEGDPWAVFLSEASDDAVLHIARTDGRVRLFCPALGIAADGATVREALARFLDHPTLRSWTGALAARSASGNLRLHPAVLLFAVVVLGLVASGEASADDLSSFARAVAASELPPLDIPPLPTAAPTKALADRQPSPLRNVAAAPGSAVSSKIADIGLVPLSQVVAAALILLDRDAGLEPGSGKPATSATAVPEPPAFATAARASAPDAAATAPVPLVAVDETAHTLASAAASGIDAQLAELKLGETERATVVSLVEAPEPPDPQPLPVLLVASETASPTVAAEALATESRVEPAHPAARHGSPIAAPGPASSPPGVAAPTTDASSAFPQLAPAAARMIGEALPAVARPENASAATAHPVPSAWSPSPQAAIIADFSAPPNDEIGLIRAVMGFLTWLSDTRTHLDVPPADRTGLLRELAASVPLRPSSELRVLVVEDGPATIPTALLMQDIVVMSVDRLPSANATAVEPLLVRLPDATELKVIGQVSFPDALASLPLVA